MVTQEEKLCTHSECTVRCHSDNCKSLCIHLYSCNCYDAQNGHLCKHIHRVHSLQTPPLTQFEDSSNNLITLQNECSTDEAVKALCMNQSVHHIQEAQSLLKTLEEDIVELNTALYPYLPHILALLNKAVVTTRACKTEIVQIVPEMEVRDNIVRGKKHDLQPRFKQTTKRKGKKRKQTFSHADSKKKQKVLQCLDNECHPEVPQVSDEPTSSVCGGKRKKVACGQCVGCKTKDCGTCRFCQDKPKFGGKGTLKQKCLQRHCQH